MSKVYMRMMFRIYLGNRCNFRGKVELSLRFRCGRVDQQARTGYWVRKEFFMEEEYLSVKGLPGRRMVFAPLDEDVSHSVRVEYCAAREYLDSLRDHIEECFMAVRRNGVGRGWLAEVIERFMAEELPVMKERQTEILSLIDAFISMTGGDGSSASRDEAYRLVRRSVGRFVMLRQLKSPSFRLTAANLDTTMLKSIESFMREEHRWVKKYPQLASDQEVGGRTKIKGQNTVNDRMKLLKAVMTWAVKTRRMPANPFDTYCMRQNVYGTPFYLTLDERRTLERCDLSWNPRLALQRDIFVFQCCVGCRVSDLTALRRSNIVDGELNYVARKTREGRPVTIKVPLNRTALEILSRYDDDKRETLFPVVYSRMGYNMVIKQILKLAGLRRQVVVINPLTREPECRPLYEVASSHMARRTFIGNIFKKFKDQGLVSELSGHAPGSQAFARYREIDSEMKREMVKTLE